MAMRRTLTVSITREQDTLLQACVQSGRYASVSEVVRAALRLLARDEVGLLPAATAEAVDAKAGVGG